LFAANQWTAYVEFRTTTNEKLKSVDERLNRLDEHLNRLDKSVAALQLETFSESPTDKNSAIEAIKAIDSARMQFVQLPPEVINQTGKRFVEAADKNPEAWDATLGFLNYKSFLNSVSLLIPSHAHATFTDHYRHFLPEGGGQPPTISVVGAVPEESAARFDLMGEDSNKGLVYASQFVFVTGGDVSIDAMQIRNVVFIGTKIFYDGGPVQMENAYFVNCIFVMKPAPKSRGLALAVLDLPPSTDFSGE